MVDVWMKVHDRDALPMAKRLIQEEGLLVGSSSGAVMHCALLAAKELKKGQKCVVLLPDNIRNYMTKFVQDTWVEVRGYKEPPNVVGFLWWNQPIGDSTLIRRDSIKLSASVQAAASYLTDNGLFCALVEDGGRFVGVVTSESILSALVNGKVSLNEPLRREAFFHQLTKINAGTTLGAVSRGLQKVQFAVILAKDSNGKDFIDGFILQKDVLKFVAEN